MSKLIWFLPRRLQIFIAARVGKRVVLHEDLKGWLVGDSTIIFEDRK